MPKGQIPIVFHLGDHDPSGQDMTRDNRERLSMFARNHVEVRRIALNYDQIEQFRPPPNRLKDKDKLSPAYAAQYGSSSWELDALSPAVIDRLVRDAIKGVIDQEVWDRHVALEQDHRATLAHMVERWGEVETFLKGRAG